jgi:hypothetical protein
MFQHKFTNQNSPSSFLLLSVLARLAESVVLSPSSHEHNDIQNDSKRTTPVIFIPIWIINLINLSCLVELKTYKSGAMVYQATCKMIRKYPGFSEQSENIFATCTFHFINK